MITVRNCIAFEWKGVSLPIHHEEELDYALNHVSYYDSPFSSSYEERKAYYGEDWYHYEGEALETLCALPLSFTKDQKQAILQEYRDKINYANVTITKLEGLHRPIKQILSNFVSVPLEEAKIRRKLLGYNKKILELHNCTEEQKQLLWYCYNNRVKERETKGISDALSSLKEIHGSEILALAIQQYKVDECLLQLKQHIHKLPALKNHL